MKQLVCGAAALVLCAAAHAESYVGGVIGSSQIEASCSLTTECSTNDTGVKIYGGYVLPGAPLPQLALEVAYINFGQARASTTSFVVRTVDVSALTFGAAMRLKFTPALQGVGRLGVARVNAEDNGAGVFGVGAKSKSGFELYAGLGLEYALNKQFKLVGTADFSSYDTGNQSGSVHLIGVGAQYGF
ncbi:MAG: outer membrane beta-barrel protein [Aquabacterium sp.]|nr:outer membrane beta-barrel protein [Aquabacterium sp.]